MTCVFPAVEKNYDCDTSQKSLLYLKQDHRSGLYGLMSSTGCGLKFHQVPMVRVCDVHIVMANQVIGQTFSVSHSKRPVFSTSSGAHASYWLLLTSVTSKIPSIAPTSLS